MKYFFILFIFFKFASSFIPIKNNIKYKEKLVCSNIHLQCQDNENVNNEYNSVYEDMPYPDDKVFTQEKINDEYNELKNRCCGEVNEKDELEQLEREFFELYQKMKKHNKKIVVKTSNDLYKLFKMMKPFNK